MDPTTTPEIWQFRAEKVKAAFMHAYHGYERYAAPADELQPITNGTINNFNGWGVTAFDSLDTMLLMGLEEEFQRALEIVKSADFSQAEKIVVPYFETIIRYLGGLLSAHALHKDPILLQRAEELVQKLDPVFSSASGLPFYGVDVRTGRTGGPLLGILAEMASLQVEYTYLAKLTGKMEHFNRSSSVMRILASADLEHTGGMLPVRWNLTTGQAFDYHLSVGAQADSAHEYLLKLYLLSGKTDKTSLEMYIRATTHIITNLLYLSPERHLLYATDSFTPTSKQLASPSHVFEHLSCFLPGLLALGAHTLPLDNLSELGIKLEHLGNETTFGYAGRGYTQLSTHNLKDIHMWAAEGLAQTCWMTYADQPTGLGPDEILMRSVLDHKPKTHLWMSAVEKWKKGGGRGLVPGIADKKPVIYTEDERLKGTGKGRDYTIRRSGYLLRPETLESMYLLWRITGDEKWRNRGWTIFEAIERETKTESGYASLVTVDRVPGQKMDSMPSYFLAETLKYLYLMFLEEDLIPLDKWVFNTEAHPLPVFEWTDEEKKRFNL
ncbi:glycoside hydrolase family 47 protein [Crassisporium funariophilum]|nr:glycoside hydrolase family 47 protein [Crassisporium funariophilum]